MFLLPLSLIAGISGSPSPSPSPKALILDSTVNGGSSSQEAQAAVAAGLDVNIVSETTWAGMTQAEFAAYRVLIIGDPSCNAPPAVLYNTISTWGPVVMGTAVHTAPGNRVLIGTDPVFHGRPGGMNLIVDGIKFASVLTGRTGLYFDASCDYGSASNVTGILQQLSVGSGTWTENQAPPCGGDVGQVATHPSFADVTSAGLRGWSCSVHETFPTFPDDWFPLFVATDTASHPTCGTDPSTGATVCGEAYILIAGTGIVVTSPNISLSPSEATNPVNTNHTVTAHVSLNGAPVAGQLVTFTVTGQNSGVSGTCGTPPVGTAAASTSPCTTNANGDVTFTYHDNNGAGDDTITASFTDGSGTKQQATAIAHWTGGSPCDTDSTPPTITAPANTVVDGNIDGSCGANVDPGTPTAADNCEIATVVGTRSDSLALTAPYPKGVTTITWTATDKKGNSASDHSTVTVNNPAPLAYIDRPANNANFRTRSTVSFAGHYTDNSGGTHTAKWTLTCDQKRGCVGIVPGTVMPDKTITAAFRFPKNSQANYTIVLTVDDGCGGTANSLPIVIHVKP